MRRGVALFCLLCACSVVACVIGPKQDDPLTERTGADASADASPFDGAFTVGDTAPGGGGDTSAVPADGLDGAADATDGDATDGDATDGDATDGDARDEDARDGDARDGDARDGDARDGDARDGDAASDGVVEGG